jgi:hypothetical protein
MGRIGDVAGRHLRPLIATSSRSACQTLCLSRFTYDILLLGQASPK